MSSNSLIFVSYRRTEFYFAESLVLELQQAGRDVWFDMQRLTPGSDWYTGIGKGLSDCTVVVLVASRNAMKSGNVRREWQAALAADKPVYIVLFEAVVLPPELQKAHAIIDMQVDFDGGVQRLLTCLEASECPQDAVARPDPLGLPLALPREVVNISLLFMCYGTGFLIWGVVTAASLPANGLIWLIALTPGVFVLMQMLLFLYRCMHYKRLQSLLIGIPFMPVILLLPVTFVSFALPDAGTMLGIGFSFVIILFLLLPFTLNVLNTQPAALLRWMPWGADSGDLRTAVRSMPSLFAPYVKRVALEEQIRVQTAHQRKLQAKESVHYRLHYEVRDVRIADKVRRAMHTHRHLEAGDNASAQHHIVIISKNTKPKFVTALVNEVSPLTPLIVDNVTFKLYHIDNLQVVDFRTRNRDILNALASYLGTPDGDGRRFGMEVMPVNEYKRSGPSIGSRLEDVDLLKTYNTLTNAFIVILILGMIVAAYMTYTQ